MPSTATIRNPFADDLDDALDTYYVDTDPDAPAQEFVVDTTDKAIWAADRMRSAIDRMAEREAAAAKRRGQIDDWLADANSADANTAAYFGALLEFYMQTEHEANEKTKTVKLPGVTLTARKKPDAWEIDDEVFVPWAVEHAPTLVKTTTVPAKAEAKKSLAVTDAGVIDTDTGEVVPGVTVTPGEVAYAAKLVDPA